jgi:hypothetical protein
LDCSVPTRFTAELTPQTQMRIQLRSMYEC